MQVAVLRIDDELPCRPAQAGDGVADWFEPMLAGRLAQAGLPTLDALAGRINQAGARWWYPVRGIGATKAARIAEWLQAQQGDTGLAVRLPARRAAAAVAEPPARSVRTHDNRGLSTPSDLAWLLRSTTHPSPSSFTT